MKFRERFPFLTSRAVPLEGNSRVYASCVRNSIIYGSENRPLLDGLSLKKQIYRSLDGCVAFP